MRSLRVQGVGKLWRTSLGNRLLRQYTCMLIFTSSNGWVFLCNFWVVLVVVVVVFCFLLVYLFFSFFFSFFFLERGVFLKCHMVLTGKYRINIATNTSLGIHRAGWSFPRCKTSLQLQQKSDTFFYYNPFDLNLMA